MACQMRNQGRNNTIHTEHSLESTQFIHNQPRMAVFLQCYVCKSDDRCTYHSIMYKYPIRDMPPYIAIIIPLL